ncbi:IS630 family transposase [Bordetella sp. FB-8]|uniref:IS630 family transposase n=1 Tax=Bordetella sp. FB-8 TaxID=1159870 RepID=UPI0004775EA6|nr:IS630 family transposase [Bordetella sp. FB-8]
MEKIDTRRLKPEALEERRRHVVRLHRQGLNRNQIAKLTELGHSTVTKVISLHEQGGMPALKLAKRGRSIGQQRRLTEAQEAYIQKRICEYRPEQLKLTFALWNRMAVSQLIEQQEFGIKLPIRTMGYYLKRWGFTPQKPIKKAYEQRLEAVKQWLDEQYPKIAQQARTEGGEIYWGDETALVNTDVRGRSFAPKGMTPVTYAPGTRQRLSMIAAVTNKGATRWQIIDGNFDSDRLIGFLEGLIKDAGKKVFLILDNLRVHHSKPVKAWLEANKAKIECFYLPSYCPELNPEERLNADLKQAIGSKVPVRTKEKLRNAANDHMAMLEVNPQRVVAYFGDPHVKYAA